jgi:hypothetical protein
MKGDFEVKLVRRETPTLSAGFAMRDLLPEKMFVPGKGFDGNDYGVVGKDKKVFTLFWRPKTRTSATNLFNNLLEYSKTNKGKQALAETEIIMTYYPEE